MEESGVQMGDCSKQRRPCAV